jgi:hypothetical protein
MTITLIKTKGMFLWKKNPLQSANNNRYTELNNCDVIHELMNDVAPCTFDAPKFCILKTLWISNSSNLVFEHE